MTSLSKPVRMTIREFLGFYETRPDEEHWELVDGVPVMMTPPVFAHQRIADNQLIALDGLLDRLGLPLTAIRQVGIELEAVDYYRPEPEIVVVDADYEPGQRHAPRFEFVCEILSPSDRRIIGKKMAYFKAHDSCHTIVVGRADRMEMRVHRRGADGWTETVLTRAEDVIESAWGPLCSLAQAYRKTPVVR